MWSGTIGLVAAGAAIGAPLGPPPRITELRPVALHPGINLVPRFLPGGGRATIVEAWRGNGNAHGHHAWMVLGGASEGNPVGLAAIEAGGAISDVVTDDPFDGERVLGAVRFVRARMAGRPVSLVIRADLDEARSHVLADRATATVRWYRLNHEAGTVGRTTDLFDQIGTVHTARRYCNAELALRDVAGVPLPTNFAGANRVDGCFGE